jgi:hypothetical protein
VFTGHFVFGGRNHLSGEQMNGISASSADHHQPHSTHHDYKASDCSFYLNLVVLDHLVNKEQHGGDSSSSPSSKNNATGGEEFTDNFLSDELHLDEVTNDMGHDDNDNNAGNNANGGATEQGVETAAAIEPKQDAEEARTAAKKVLLRASSAGSSSSSASVGAAAGIFKKTLHGLESSNLVGGKAFSMGKALHGVDKSLRNSMHGFSKASSQVANKANAFAARKTMVNRAHVTLTKCLPEIASLYSTDDFLTIGRRFSQGKVTVLHVVLKPSAMSRYLSDIVKHDNSNETTDATGTTTTTAADQYSSAMSTLQALNATETMKCLEREMLHQVRKGLMSKLSALLLQKMNDMESGLELECIALEEAEEARWLFTFMEFQAQMKS